MCPQEGRASTEVCGFKAMWPLVPIWRHGSMQQQQVPYCNPEVSLRIDLERKVGSSISDLVVSIPVTAVLSGFCCWSLTGDGSWTSRALGSRQPFWVCSSITWACQNLAVYAEAGIVAAANIRSPESQNCRGWVGPLEIIEFL